MNDVPHTTYTDSYKTESVFERPLTEEEQEQVNDQMTRAGIDMGRIDWRDDQTVWVWSNN